MSENSQIQALPVTKSSGVTEERRVILGLEGFSVFYVFAIFAFVQISLDKFPLSIVATFFAYTFFKVYLKGKPPHYLEYIALYYFRHKKHSHRCGEKPRLFADEP